MKELETGNVIFTLRLKSKEKEYALNLPTREKLNEAEIVGLSSDIPYLLDNLPLEGAKVDDANELAAEIEEMMCTDGELLKYIAALTVEKPDNFADALDIAIDIDNYERVTEDLYEYGREALERLGIDSEAIETIEDYMNMEEFGAAAMSDDGVVRTEFGLLRRLRTPFPSQENGQTMS